ncbi:hypothetical protein JB92DRAFT_3135607 [Gautieria morchelliformis]|nr:hypothetical protein JB92DRAFT_3135607 [Gautieria morchelliformis]
MSQTADSVRPKLAELPCASQYEALKPRPIHVSSTFLAPGGSLYTAFRAVALHYTNLAAPRTKLTETMGVTQSRLASAPDPPRYTAAPIIPREGKPEGTPLHFSIYSWHFRSSVSIGRPNRVSNQFIVEEIPYTVPPSTPYPDLLPRIFPSAVSGADPD